MSKQCAICNNKIGILGSPVQVSDGYICKNCIHKVTQALNFDDPLTVMQTLKISQMSVETIKDKLNNPIQENLEKNETTNEITEQDSNDGLIDSEQESPDDVFDINRAVNADGLYADFTSKILMAELSFMFKTKQELHYFKDITGYKPIIEGHEVKKHHGIARAATGGILFGGAGAIVGAVTGGKQYDVVNKIGITVFLSDGNTFGATMLSEEKKADSWTVKGAQAQLDKWCNLLDRVINDNQTQGNKTEKILHSSGADEIRKYKGLLDDGIISQEEFDKKKSELLNL